MKNSKMLVALVCTYLTTVLLIGVIAYLLNDMGFKETMQHPGTWILGTIVGAAFCICVGQDLDNKWN